MFCRKLHFLRLNEEATVKEIKQYCCVISTLSKRKTTQKTTEKFILLLIFNKVLVVLNKE